MPNDSLVMRLCFRPAYFELAHMVGYHGLPVAEAREKFKLLEARFGRTVMMEASKELVRVDDRGERAILSDEARKACRGVLGPPPEEWDSFYRNTDGSPSDQHAEKMMELKKLRNETDVLAEEPPKKRTRRKKSA